MFSQVNFCRDLTDVFCADMQRSRDGNRAHTTGMADRLEQDRRGLIQGKEESLADYFRRVHNADSRITSFNHPNPILILEGVICTADHCFDKECPNNTGGLENLRRVMERFRNSSFGLKMSSKPFVDTASLRRPDGVLGRFYVIK